MLFYQRSIFENDFNTQWFRYVTTEREMKQICQKDDSKLQKKSRLISKLANLIPIVMKNFDIYQLTLETIKIVPGITFIHETSFICFRENRVQSTKSAKADRRKHQKS